MEQRRKMFWAGATSVLGLGLLARHLSPPSEPERARPTIFETRSPQPRLPFDAGPVLDRILLSAPSDFHEKPPAPPPAKLETAEPPPAPARPPAIPEDMPPDDPPPLPLSAFEGMSVQGAPAPTPHLKGFDFERVDRVSVVSAQYYAEDPPESDGSSALLKVWWGHGRGRGAGRQRRRRR